MSDWPTLPLLEAVFDTTSGNPKTPQSEYLEAGKYPVVDQGKHLVAGFTDDPLSLHSTDGPVIIFGDHTRCFKYVDFPFAMGADGVKVLQPRTGWEPKFLYYYLSSLPIPNAGYSRHFKFLKEQRVVQPPVDEQRRIVGALDQADELRAKRREALAHLDNLTQSVFIDMFPPHTPSTRLGDHLAFVTSGGRGWARYYAETGSRFIRSLDVRMNEIDDKAAAYVQPPANAEARRTEVWAGDVLLTITGSRIGRVSAIPPDLAGSYVSQHVAILRLHPQHLKPEFLSYFLSLPSGGQRQIAKAQYGQTKPGLNFEQIREFQIPSPPLADQEEFGERLAKTERLKATQRANLVQLDALFASLQDRAFQGAL